jgi:predicted nucleic acid-binding protein
MSTTDSFTYWDTSALLKVYAPESDSAAYRTLLTLRPQAVICWLHPLEMAYALHHKEVRREITPGSAARITARFDADESDGRYLVVPWGLDLRRATRDVLSWTTRASQPVAIRTLDGIHLAAARIAGVTDIVTDDRRMRAAAAELGFSVVDPC